MTNRYLFSFNPRARVGGATYMLKQSMLWLHVVSNPRARVGRDKALRQPISLLLEFSIHAPAWGATLLHYCKYGLYYSFNPRARVGRDIFVHAYSAMAMVVSIHAPAWGATDYIG